MNLFFKKTLAALPDDIKLNSITKKLCEEVDRIKNGGQFDYDVFNDIKNVEKLTPQYASLEYGYTSDLGDHRFLFMALRAFRGFNAINEDDYYGLTLGKNDNENTIEPVSMVILGMNGSGKTSLYSALELLALGEVSVAKKRQYDKTRRYDESHGLLYDFLQNVNSSEKLKAVLCTCSSYIESDPVKSLGGIFENLYCGAFFCSESDVNIFEMKGGRIDLYIEGLLGLEEIDIAISIIDNANKKLSDLYESFSTEQKNFSALIIDETIKAKEIEEILNELKGREQSLIEPLQPFDSPKRTDYRNAKRAIRGLINENTQKLDKANAEIKRIQDAMESNPSDYLKTTMETLNVIKSCIQTSKTKLKCEILPSVEELLWEIFRYHLDENEGIRFNHKKISYIENGVEKIAEIMDGQLMLDRTGEKLDPRLYFNNFRFKLYITSLRAAIAIHLMKHYDMSFPLVFDDVFDSSDFNNRALINEFIESVALTYDRVIGNNKKGGLQIIFFTQDEMLASGVLDGLRNSRKSAKMVRLFNKKYSDKNDDISLDRINNLPGEKGGRINKYSNLYDIVKEIYF